MISSAIRNLERAVNILNDIPSNIDKERTRLLSAINDVFEDHLDKCNRENKEELKRFSSLRKDVMGKIEEFCDTVCTGVKEDVRIIEE